MRVYVDIKNIKLEDLRTLYALAETNDGRRTTVGGDISAWAIDDVNAPSRPKGHWIPVYGKNGKTIMSYKCSECEFHPKHAIITNFCGGCGADMRGE